MAGEVGSHEGRAYRTSYRPFDKPRVCGPSRGTPYARGAVLPSEGNGWCSRSYSTLITAPMMTISDEK